MHFCSSSWSPSSALRLQTKSMKLYEACLTLLQVYSKNNQCRKRSDAAAEEDQYQDLLLIMELLTNLLSKEFIDFSDTGGFREASQAIDRSSPHFIPRERVFTRRPLLGGGRNVALI